MTAIDFTRAQRRDAYREAMWEQARAGGTLTKRDRRGFDRGWELATLTAMNLVARLVNLEMTATTKDGAGEAG